MDLCIFKALSKLVHTRLNAFRKEREERFLGLPPLNSFTLMPKIALALYQMLLVLSVTTMVNLFLMAMVRLNCSIHFFTAYSP